MKIPLEISFKDIAPSPAIEQYVREHAAKLDKFHERVMACRVSIEAPHRHQHKGKLYQVRIDLTVPGEELVANRSPAADASHADVYVAARDAFRAIKRQLQDYGRRRRGKGVVEAADPPALIGKVVRLEPEREIGYLVDLDGQEVFFHRNSVRGKAYGKLAIGSDVHHVAIEGANGHEATKVWPKRLSS
ncbi:MAG: HPF/RaiA family ribosome-associated protein [Alphaproteobacteria bacterium]|nr:HPF/RaiA family ribosome-associated protein [Alphaproteobacteria bacterium]